MKGSDLKCDVRGAGQSFHVEYTINEPDGYETENLTHHSEPRSEDDLAEDDIEVGWVVERDDPGFAMVHLFEGDDQTIVHRVKIETCFQLADMFRQIGELVKEEQIASEEKELSERIEDARRNPPLPFDHLA